MKFAYTTDEKVRMELKSQGLTELGVLKTNDMVTYCFSVENNLNMNFSNSGQLVFSDTLFL